MISPMNSQSTNERLYYGPRAMYDASCGALHTKKCEHRGSVGERNVLDLKWHFDERVKYISGYSTPANDGYTKIRLMSI